MYNEQDTMSSLLKDRSLYQSIMLNCAGTGAFSGLAQNSEVNSYRDLGPS